MNEMKGDWDNLLLFLAVARGGGLSPAAQATGRSAATLGRRMLALEQDLKRELFVRHDRGYALTADGRTLLEELTDVEARILRVTAKPTDAAQSVVKVSAGTWTTIALIAGISEIMGTPPDIRLRFISAEDILDIPRREIVIGFRNQRPSEMNLAGRKLGQVHFAPYATADAPDRWIKVQADTPSARWLDKTIGHDAICEVTAPRNSLDLALAGQGIALLPTFIGDVHRTLSRRGNTIAELSHDQWIVTHQDDRHIPAVRRAIDRMCKVLQG